ncbi:hypothetical protein DKX15_20085, partial [Enterococcus faecium]
TRCRVSRPSVVGVRGPAAARGTRIAAGVALRPAGVAVGGSVGPVLTVGADQAARSAGAALARGRGALAAGLDQAVATVATTA